MPILKDADAIPDYELFEEFQIIPTGIEREEEEELHIKRALEESRKNINNKVETVSF